MEAIAREELTSALKQTTLAVLDELIAHQIKGAELIKRGMVEMMTIKKELEDHYEALKTLLNLLKPMFEIVRDWLVKCYQHLVDLFDWAKKMWHEIFG